MGKTNLHPQELVSVLFIIVLMGNRKSFGRLILKVEWISDKRGTLCCIYMKFSHEKSSPSWHPYRYQVASTQVASTQVSRWPTARWWGPSRSSSPSAPTVSPNSAWTTLCSLTWRGGWFMKRPKFKLLTKVGTRCRDLPADGWHRHLCKVSIQSKGQFIPRFSGFGSGSPSGAGGRL